MGDLRNYGRNDRTLDLRTFDVMDVKDRLEVDRILQFCLGVVR